MAKHDQRILKFLAQNSDRAPTITDMMTRLNISISEISASLSSLLAQGLIAKKTNNQGIECWFPAGNGAASAAMDNRPASVDPRFIGGGLPERHERQMVSEPVSVASQSYSAGAQHLSAVAELPMPSSPSVPPPMAMPAPAKGGIGVFALLVGIAVAVTISAFMANRLVERSVTHLSQGFVDMKVLNDAITTMNVSQSHMQSQVRSLEDQVKKLGEDLSALKSADSLKTAGKVEEKKAPPPPAPVEAAAPAKKTRRHRGG
jgi:hypothetical protein